MKFLHLVSAVFLSTSIASACSNLGGPCDLFVHCCGTLKCSSTDASRGECVCAKLGESCSDGYGFRPPGCCQGLVCDQPLAKGGKCIYPPTPANESKYDCPRSFTQQGRQGPHKYNFSKKEWYSNYFLCTYTKEGEPRSTSDCDYYKDTGALGNYHNNPGCPKQAPRV